MKLETEDHKDLKNLKLHLKYIRSLKVALWIKVKRLGMTHPEVLQFHADMRGYLGTIVRKYDKK